MRRQLMPPDFTVRARSTKGGHHQVKRFTADGQLVMAFGRPEGRGDGAYVPTDFRGLTDIEADAEGGFVVTEGNHTPPRRTARFDVDGKLMREWFGAQHYGIIVCPEPNDPRHVWFMANRWSDHVVSLEGGKVRFQLQGDEALETPGSFNDGQWHQIVTTVGPGGQRLHVDGKLIGTGKLAQRTKTSNRLGLDLGPGSGNGTVTIDELQIFGHALAKTEVIQLSD